jgi:N-acetylmuramoyl-L-alanine amidase
LIDREICPQGKVEVIMNKAELEEIQAAVGPEEPKSPCVDCDELRDATSNVPIPKIEIIEINALLDATNSQIVGSTEPQTIPHRHPMIKSPSINFIAHRELKIHIYTEGYPVNAHEGKQVTWSMTPLFIAPGTNTPSFRGRWTQAAATHRNRFEASSSFGNCGFSDISQQQASTTVNAEGHSAIRVNLPPIGFNAARIHARIEGNDEDFELIDVTVSAVIVIDPGHGGTTTLGGSSSNNATSIGDANGDRTLEKDLTLDLGLRLRDRLESLASNEEHLRVIMTRSDDRNLGIAARANVARDNGADIFLSLHFNGNTSAQVYGSETWIRPQNSNNNFNADHAFATRIQNALDGSIPDARQPGAQGYRGVKSNIEVSGTLNDTSLGNSAGQPMSRAALAELEFITNQTVEDNLISGLNARQNSQAIIDALADAVIDDIRHQE